MSSFQTSGADDLECPGLGLHSRFVEGLPPWKLYTSRLPQKTWEFIAALVQKHHGNPMFWKYFLLGEIWSRPDAYICILWWDGDGTIWVMTWFDLRYSIAKPISIPFWQFWSFSLRSAHGCLEALRSLRGMSLSVQHTMDMLDHDEISPAFRLASGWKVYDDQVFSQAGFNLRIFGDYPSSA